MSRRMRAWDLACASKANGGLANPDLLTWLANWLGLETLWFEAQNCRLEI